MTFYAFPQPMHHHIRSTNAIESFFRTVRRRTDQIDAFTTETSCPSIVWAVMQGIRLAKITASEADFDAKRVVVGVSSKVAQREKYKERREKSQSYGKA